MQSPKDSSKHSLVTYGSDISDEEFDILSNIPLPPREPSNDASNDMRSMDISPITNDSKSNASNEPTPKDRNSVVIPLKRKKTNDSNIGGLVSYGMDEDDIIDDEEFEEENDSEPYQQFNNDKESSNEKDPLDLRESAPVDNDECFNIEGRESDVENDEIVRPSGDIDLKSRSGQSSSQVKAIVLTKRPKGSELAYLLSRQILNNRSEIHLPPVPPGKPPLELEQRISELRAKARSARWNMTQSILNNKEYRNPSIYEKLIEHMKIDERGTNYPPELYDPYRFGEESYYEVLAKAQDAAERKRLEQGSSGTVSKASKTTTTKTDTELRLRKTKWDTGTKPQISKSYSNTSGVVIETKVMFPAHK